MLNFNDNTLNSVSFLCNQVLVITAMIWCIMCELAVEDSTVMAKRDDRKALSMNVIICMERYKSVKIWKGEETGHHFCLTTNLACHNDSSTWIFSLITDTILGNTIKKTQHSQKVELKYKSNKKWYRLMLGFEVKTLATIKYVYFTFQCAKAQWNWSAVPGCT